MPLSDFAVDSYVRAPYGIPESRLLNMYCEDTPAGPGPQARICRPGLVKSYVVGQGPIKGVFWKDGVVGSKKFVVSGTELYADDVLLGTVATGDRAYMAGSGDQLGVVIGGNLYCYDGTTFQQITTFYTQASATLTFVSNAPAFGKVRIGTQAYNFVDTPAIPDDVLLGATTEESIGNLIAAIVGGSGEGTVYGPGTVANADATAAVGTGTTLVATAIVYGVAGESVEVVTDMVGVASWDSATLAGIDPLPAFSGISYTAERFYLTIVGSDQYDYCNLSDLTQIDPLNFATAESEPDPNRQIAEIGDEVWFFGTETVEPWYQTGNNDAPLQRAQGRRFEKGCAAQATVVTVDNTLFFLGSDNIVYRSGQVPDRISTHGVESQINKCVAIETCSAFLTNYAGHSFYVLNIPGVTTFAFDVAKSQWSEWTSFGQLTFKGAAGQMIFAQAFIGSAYDGTIYTLSDGVNTDDGEPITCLATSYIPVKAGRNVNFSLMLQCNRGLGVAGGREPVVEMRYSDDQCRTWSNWRQASLGKMGQFRHKAVWRNLGLMQSPGRNLEFRVTDSVPITFEYVTFNEARP